jgi:superoxide dismutase
MKFEPPKLPYPIEAREPHLAPKNLEIHCDTLHRGDLEELWSPIEEIPEQRRERAELVTRVRGEILENAAQIWNYNFDSQNARQRYGEAFISQLANWRFAGAHPEASNSKCVS